MLRRLQKILCAVLIATLLVSAVAPAMAESKKAKVTSSSAKIYRSASTKSDHAKLKKGTKVTVTAVKGSWAKVKVSGKTVEMPSYDMNVGKQTAEEKNGGYTIGSLNEQQLVYFIGECLRNAADALASY